MSEFEKAVAPVEEQDAGNVVPESAAGVEETSDEAAEGEQPEAVEAEKPKHSKKLQDRIDELTRARYQAEARAEMAAREAEELRRKLAGDQPAQPKAPAGAPKPEDFATWDEYQDAQVEWKVQQTLEKREAEQRERQAKREAEENQRRFQEKIAEFAASNPDFVPAVAAASATWTEAMSVAVMESGPELAYWLAKNPAEAAKIAAMKPTAALIALGRIQAQQVSGSSPKPIPEPKPKPTTPIAPTGASTAKLRITGKESLAEYIRLREQGAEVA